MAIIGPLSLIHHSAGVSAVNEGLKFYHGGLTAKSLFF